MPEGDVRAAVGVKAVAGEGEGGGVGVTEDI